MHDILSNSLAGYFVKYIENQENDEEQSNVVLNRLLGIVKKQHQTRNPTGTNLECVVCQIQCYKAVFNATKPFLAHRLKWL